MALPWLRSWRTRLIALTLTFAVLPAVVVGMLAFNTFDRSSRTSTLQSLEGIARTKADAIDEFIVTRRKDAERMANVLAPRLVELNRTRAASVPSAPDDTDQPQPQPLLDGDKPAPPMPPVPGDPGVTPPDDVGGVAERRAHAALRDVLGLLLGDQGTFEELLLIRPDGVVEASTFSEHEGKTAVGIDYYERGRGATYVQPPFVSPITKELTMVIATPIRNGAGLDIGVLAARLNLKRFFQALHDYTGLGNSGETIVVSRKDGALAFMAPTRHDGEAALRQAARGFGVYRAAEGQTGYGEATDYRGADVFAAWRPIPSLGWGLVTKIDRDEALSDLYDTRTDLVITTGIVVLMAIVVSLLLATSFMRPLRQLRVAADRISKGDLDVEIDINSRDEVGELADSFQRMIAAIKFFRETASGAEPSEPDLRLDTSGDAEPSDES